MAMFLFSFRILFIASPIISISLSTARLKHRSLQNSLKYFGLSPKNDSISLIASNISCKCLFIFSSIYQLLCRINTFPEIRIFYGLFLDQVDLPPEQVLQRILEIEVIVEIVLHFVFLEINDQINVALVIKSVSQHRPEYEKPVYLVPFAQGNYVLDMIVYQFHLSANIR